MCCFFAALVIAGPRLAILVWWIYDPARWQLAFEHFFVSFLGFLFLPWTTLGWVLVANGGVEGLDWVIVALAFLLDVLSYSGSLYGNREYSDAYA